MIISCVAAEKYIFDVYIITCDDLHLIDAQIVVNPHFLRLDLIYGLRSMQTCFLNCSNDIKNSGSGRFLMWLAKRNLDSKNYLGLEIRKKVWGQIPWLSNPVENSCD
ncbi:hypothetical protein CsSME_00001900 [Camellia sinensis var. sinensis]